jgi:hypothetical protein
MSVAAALVVIVSDVAQFEQSSRPVAESDVQAGCAIPPMPRTVEIKRPPAPP